MTSDIKTFPLENMRCVAAYRFVVSEPLVVQFSLRVVQYQLSQVPFQGARNFTLLALLGCVVELNLH